MDLMDIYNDLDEFHEQEQKKSKELLELENKYNEALKTIEAMKLEKKDLRKKIRIMEQNLQSLLDTAKAEIKRKDKIIDQLRKEKDDICFRRQKVALSNISFDSWSCHPQSTLITENLNAGNTGDYKDNSQKHMQEEKGFTTSIVNPFKNEIQFNVEDVSKIAELAKYTIPKIRERRIESIDKQDKDGYRSRTRSTSEENHVKCDFKRQKVESKTSKDYFDNPRHERKFSSHRHRESSNECRRYEERKWQRSRSRERSRSSYDKERSKYNQSSHRNDERDFQRSPRRDVSRSRTSRYNDEYDCRKDRRISRSRDRTREKSIEKRKKSYDSSGSLKDELRNRKRRRSSDSPSNDEGSWKLKEKRKNEKRDQRQQSKVVQQQSEPEYILSNEEDQVFKEETIEKANTQNADQYIKVNKPKSGQDIETADNVEKTQTSVKDDLNANVELKELIVQSDNNTIATTASRFLVKEKTDVEITTDENLDFAKNTTNPDATKRIALFNALFGSSPPKNEQTKRAGELLLNANEILDKCGGNSVATSSDAYTDVSELSIINSPKALNENDNNTYVVESKNTHLESTSTKNVFKKTYLPFGSKTEEIPGLSANDDTSLRKVFYTTNECNDNESVISLSSSIATHDSDLQILSSPDKLTTLKNKVMDKVEICNNKPKEHSTDLTENSKQSYQLTMPTNSLNTETTNQNNKISTTLMINKVEMLVSKHQTQLGAVVEKSAQTNLTSNRKIESLTDVTEVEKFCEKADIILLNVKSTESCNIEKIEGIIVLDVVKSTDIDQVTVLDRTKSMEVVENKTFEKIIEAKIDSDIALEKRGTNKIDETGQLNELKLTKNEIKSAATVANKPEVLFEKKNNKMFEGPTVNKVDTGSNREIKIIDKLNSTLICDIKTLNKSEHHDKCRASDESRAKENELKISQDDDVTVLDKIIKDNIEQAADKVVLDVLDKGNVHKIVSEKLELAATSDTTAELAVIHDTIVSVINEITTNSNDLATHELKATENTNENLQKTVETANFEEKKSKSSINVDSNTKTFEAEKASADEKAMLNVKKKKENGKCKLLIEENEKSTSSSGATTIELSQLNKETNLLIESTVANEEQSKANATATIDESKNLSDDNLKFNDAAENSQAQNSSLLISDDDDDSISDSIPLAQLQKKEKIEIIENIRLPTLFELENSNKKDTKFMATKTSSKKSKAKIITKSMKTEKTEKTRVKSFSKSTKPMTSAKIDLIKPYTSLKSIDVTDINEANCDSGKVDEANSPKEVIVAQNSSPDEIELYSVVVVEAENVADNKNNKAFDQVHNICSNKLMEKSENETNEQENETNEQEVIVENSKENNTNSNNSIANVKSNNDCMNTTNNIIKTKSPASKQKISIKLSTLKTVRNRERKRKLLNSSEQKKSEEFVSEGEANTVATQINCEAPEIHKKPSIEKKKNIKKSKLLRKSTASSTDEDTEFKMPQLNTSDELKTMLTQPATTSPLTINKMNISSPIQNDNKFDDIEKDMQAIFQSPLKAKEINPTVNVTINETMNSSQIEQSANNTDKSLHESSFETKRLSLGTTQYLVECDAENVATIFITRRKRKKRAPIETSAES